MNLPAAAPRTAAVFVEVRARKARTSPAVAEVLRLIEGGRERSALPRALRIGGEAVRLGAPLTPDGLCLDGEWEGRPVAVRFMSRAAFPGWPRVLEHMHACGGAVPRVYGVERWEDMWCALLEPLAGTTLALRLATTARPPARRWVNRLAWQLAFALERAHAAGLTCGRLTESNVWVTPEHYVKVLDWGEGSAATDYQKLEALCERLGMSLPPLKGPALLAWFEARARRRSVYEPLR